MQHGNLDTGLKFRQVEFLPQAVGFQLSEIGLVVITEHLRLNIDDFLLHLATQVSLHLLQHLSVSAERNDVSVSRKE